MACVLNQGMQLSCTEEFRVEMSREHLRFEVVFCKADSFHIERLFNALFAHFAVARHLEGDDFFLIAGESHADDGKEHYQRFADVFHGIVFND